jgi:hypothetical protein
MPGLADVAALFAAAATGGHTPRTEVPPTGLNYDQVHYDVQLVATSSGLGGIPPYCVASGSELVLVVYTARNTTDSPISGGRLQRLVIFNAEGVELQPNAYYTELVALKANPPLLLHKGQLGARESAVRADVFVTKRNAVRDMVWRVRPAPPATVSYLLNQSQRVVTTECPEPSAQPPTGP